MKINKLSVIIFLIFLFITTSYVPVYALNAVASIKQVMGAVQVERHEPDRLLTGRIGLILKEQDVIITGDQAKATILFRDGTEIRVFQKTRFTISSSKETETSGSRLFIHKIILKWGSFWGKFAKGKQKSFIETPTATAGIKGTVVSFKEENGEFTTSLASGSVEIENQDSSILLVPGKMLNGVTKNGSIKDKVKDLPYQLKITPDTQKINLPMGDEQETFFLNVQMVDIKSNRNISRSGPIYISTNSDKIQFPDQVILNNRGYTRIKGTVEAFKNIDFKDGKIQITAIMDGEDFMDVSAGHTLIIYDIPKSSNKAIKIDSKTGKPE